VTHSAFPYPPATPSGDWLVNLPGQASIGEVLVWATAAPANPWDTPPVAPAGVLTSVATTFIVPAGWIDTGGDSFVLPAGGTLQFKQLFRVTGTPPQAGSTVAWFQVVTNTDLNADGTYTITSFDPTNVFFSFTFTAYGPGDITPDGLLLPADAGALYCHLHQIAGVVVPIRYGPPVAHVEYSTATGAGGTGTIRNYWRQTDAEPPLRNLQRIDNEATHTIPLIPDRLPI
jgi:hypothetical protein